MTDAEGFQVGDMVTVYSPDSDQDVTGIVYYVSETSLAIQVPQENQLGRCVGGPFHLINPRLHLRLF